ncbi:TPA: PLxRFG domain-containing protein [Neisseria meningitidis]|uniref:PLxRFG domain-containing protein n=2 Tax=Neisseria meningitidis TaxID=487 RepID=UPI00059B7239|nr:PLxRFG domain-containing protein [Neisseria meningitidis]MBG8595981.1 PLxRFG domain-containing protein [Neisseria meningitidis]MBG8655215.1 PLxRFG domain-containing protein [Neisseria meningitidis]MBG8657109.1 PLxRFG domain-containing protein [Neisseria meningitidis]MBG8828204.1 PLxRFG domain-containing protein [Neisseria meningitidis]MBG8830489.1 PLxRFG domain-containing protein [Neisseria meningitidis]
MSDLVRYDPLEHGQLVGGLKKYRGFTQKDAWAAADDTALTRGFKNSMRSARMAWNDLTGDKEELGQLKAEDMDYRKIQEGRKSQARRELGEAWEKGEGVGGGLSNVWEELKKDWREKGLDGVLEDVGEMGGATLEQAPNALVPLATTTVGGILGTLAGGNTAVGAYAGATLGNTLMEYGEQLDRAAEAAGVDPTDKDAMMAFIDRGAPGALKNAAVKGAVVGAVDMATMKLGGSILNMGKKAAEKAALKKMGVAAADKAAVAAAKGTPEFAALAKESAKGGLGGAARHAAAFALEPASEFAGEYLGTGLANGEWDEKGAALEAFSSLGHSAVEFVGTKAYAAISDPLRLSAEQKADALADAKGNIEGNRKAGKLTPEEAQALGAAVEAALDGGVEQGGAGFDTAHHDQLYLTLQQFVDRTKQKEAEQFFNSPADGNTPHAEELAREMEKQPDVSGIPSEDEAEFLNTGVMSDGLARQYADMAAKYRAKPSEAMGIDPDDGAISAAAALAVDSGAAVPSVPSDDVETPTVADDVLSGRSADADRGGVSSAYGNVRSGGAASVASGGAGRSAAAASGGIARVAPLPAGQYFDGLDTRGRKALAKEAGFDIKGVADFGQIAEPVRQKIEEAYHARIEADYQAASEAKQGYLPPPVRMADAVPVPKKGFSVPADALNKESRRRFDALPETVRRHAQTVADYTADGIMRQEAGMADMRGHYPAGLAESVRVVRAYRAEHPESADVLDRLNRAVYGYRRNNGWRVPLLSREGERLQGVRTALPDDGASEAVVGGGRGLPRALPTEDKGLAQDVRQDVRQGLTQGGRGLTPDTGADANAAALQGLPESAAVASGNAPTHRQNLQVRAHAEGAAPGLSASENLAETDGGKRAPVAGKRPDTVLPVLNPQVAESAVKVSPKKRMADAAADFTRRLAADRRKLEKAGVPLGDGEYRFEHTNRQHIDALAGVLDRLGKGGMLEEFADMAGSSHSDGLVFDSRRYLKGKEAETLQAGGLLEAVPSKSGWDYRLTQEGRALAKVMARSRDAAASAGKSAGKAQSARAKDTPVAGKAAVAKNAANEKPSSDKAAKPETLVKTALDNPQEARRKARVLQGEPVYTVKERTAPGENKALREWAVALFDKAGGKAVNPEAGEILLNERSVRDSIAHGMNPFKAEAFAAIPDVISQGVVIHEGVNPENGTRYVYISAPVEIEGKDDVVTLLARNTGNGSQMYLHSVATKESILNASDTETAEISRETGKVNSGYIASVLKKLLKYKTQGGKTEDTPSEGLRFSRSEQTKSAFENRIDALFGGAKANLKGVRVLDKSDLLDMLGYGGMPVELNESKVVLNRKNHPEMTAQQWKKVPKWLDNPVAVLKSKTHDKRLVFVPDELIDGAPVYLVVEPNSRGLDIHVLVNGYAKDGNPQQTFRDIWRDLANGNTEFVDSKKARELLGRSGLQLPRLPSLNTSRKKILTEKNLQGYRKSEKTDTGQQHAESIKKRLAESIGRLAEQVDVAAVSETAPDKAQMLLSERVEGWFDGRTGKITLVAENLTPERAVWVAWHELGHRGFAADGFAKYRAELERADGNSLIRRIADAVQEEREGTGDAAASVRSAAVEEAVVELYAAQRTGDWSGIENRYGVKVGNGLKRGIAGVLARIGAVLRRVLQRLAGKADGAMSDADVFAMLADLHGNAEGARDASSDGVKPSRSAMKDTDANIRRGRAAMNRALVEKADVRRAMYRNDIGWIDFVWGGTGRVLPNGKTKGAMGLAHVIESRMRKDGMGRDEVVGMLTNDIVEAIARGKVYKHVVNGNSERLQLRHNGYEANLIKNAGNNAWLITGYELYQNGADGVGFDTSAATHTTPTPARRDVGASDTPNVRAKDESVNTADGTRNSRAAERSKSESLEKLRRAETIRISGREIEAGDDLRQYRRRAMEYGKSLRGSYVNKDTGREISLGRAGITEVLHHDVSNPEHLQSIAAIPQIIEKSIYIDTLPNEDKAKNPDIQEYEYYVAGLNIGGTDYTVKAAIAVATTGDKYYDHKLTRIEKGDLLEMTSRLSSAEISNQSPLSDIDDKRLLQILQDKDAGKGGIADFDTEAVRFSRAANIGAAIGHITGKKSDLRNALKDRWDASKGIQLQFLGRRQIEDIYGGDLDGLKEYGRLSELFGADANKAVTEADKVVREWGRLKKADAKALADLMHDATLAKVDADPLMRGDAQKRLDGIRTALDIADGKIVKARAVIASADARIARADAAYNKASEAAKKAQSALLAAEEKAGREILADEADMRLRRLFYADSEAKRALRHAEADVMAESRAKTDAVQMLKQARADVRRLEKDEVGAQKALEGLALLNRRFAKLPDAAQRVYRKARDDYRAHFGQVRDALAERLARSGQDAEIVRRLKERFDNELGGVYFPLARFGDYLVVVKDADGNSVNVSRAETLSEAEKLRDALKADFGAGFKVSPVMKSRDYIQSRDAVSGGFMKELGEAVGMLDLDPAQQAQLNDTLTQLYLNSLPDTSWAKHGIHRKGVPGFGDDARRAYAQNMGSGANYLAKLRYADRMAEQLDVMQDFVDGRKYVEGFNQRQLQRVADEMRKRHEAVMNPNPSKLAQALTGFGFLWMMGMSPALAIVNLSQTAMVAYPVMAAKWGYADAARELLRASKQIGLKVGEKFNTIEDSLNEDEKAAFQKAVDYGVIDLSQAHDLAGVANGDPGLAGSAWQKVMDKASWLFHHTEKFNRQVTFVAAYRLAKRAGADSDTAFEQAKKATYDGHFDYAAQNRPRFMMGNVAKVVFLFKQYSQNILYALGRNAYLAFKGDKEARKTLAGLLVSHAMASGILGLPFVSTLLAVASMLGSDDDDPWDAEAALRNMLADTFGDKAGEVMAKGFSRLTPLDVSGRLGLNQLIFPDIQDGLAGKKWAESLVVGSTGAVVGAGIGAADGVQKILDGRYMEGLESMLPVAIRNPLKAVRYATDGQVDKSGITVKDDFNLFELAGQAAGFRSSDLALKQEGKSAVYRRDRALSAARAKILSAMAKAVVEQDAAALRELRGVVAQWNRKHPERAIKSENIMSSVRNRQRRVAGAKDGIYLSDKHSDARTDGGFAFGH